MDKQKIGKFIMQLRKSKGMTQKNLADEIGVTDKAVSKWERGLGVPDVSILPSLANHLGVTIEEILSGVQETIHTCHDEQANEEMPLLELEKQPAPKLAYPNFLKHKFTKVLLIIQVIQSIGIVILGLVSLLYAGEMGGSAIADTLKGLLATWIILVTVFGTFPLFMFYLWRMLKRSK